MTDNPLRKGLGRRVARDPRSRAFAIRPRGIEIHTVEHRRTAPILDQGELGSCTGNATVGCLGTEPFVQTLPNVEFNEELAVSVYSEATRVDDFPGDYPPDDTGSDGNSVAKAARNMGYISGWQHLDSVQAAKEALQETPFIFGTNWYNSMFDPDPDGVVHVKGGEADVAGGHEIECVGYDVERDRWKFANSWGDGWGDKGYFYLSGADFERLFSENGDATVFVPISQPAPEPTPVDPTPQPEPTPVDPTPVDPTPVDPTPAPQPDVPAFPVEKVRKWLDGRHYTRREERAAETIRAWIEESS